METELIWNHSLTNSSGLSNLSNTATDSSTGKEAFKRTNAEIARLIQIIIRPILIIVGKVGNCLTFYIMRKTSLKDASSCFYMSILALADTMVLCSGCFVQWIVFLTHYQIDPRKWTDCKLYHYMVYFGRHYSSMLLVLMSIEKCFAVYFPLKSKTVCTVRTAKWATGVVGIVLEGYDLFYLVGVESFIIKSYDRHICVLNRDYMVILTTTDSVLYSFGPLTIMFITNFAIAFKFMGAKWSSNRSNSTESTNQALSKSATRGTAMVVTVSVTFLLLTAPTAVNQALHKLYYIGIRLPLYRAFMNLTQYLNHSINGVLYIIVGSKFRKELLNIFSRKERPEGLSFSHSVKNIGLNNISGN